MPIKIHQIVLGGSPFDVYLVFVRDVLVEIIDDLVVVGRKSEAPGFAHLFFDVYV
jgi:hypothetical protein